MSNNSQPQESFAQGLITLNVRDADTMEIKRTVEVTNAICTGGVFTLIMRDDTTLFDSGSGLFAGRDIVISDRICSNGMRTMGTAYINKSGESRVLEDSAPQEWTFFEGSPDYVEKVGRFLQPGSNRTINSIGIIGDFDGYMGFATAALSTPCIQTTAEVLDVTYRIQFFYQTPDPLLLPVAANYGRDIAKKISFPFADEYFHRFPADTTIMGTSVPVDGSMFNGQLCNPTNFGNGAPIKRDHLKVEYPMDNTITENIGTIIKSLGYGGDSASPAYLDLADIPSMSIAWAPIAPPSFVNMPIQTIHNHSADAIEWGLDVDFLATGQGSLTVDGSAWTDPDWPEFYRIDHTLSGQVGVSRYAFRSRRTTGFNGNTYENPPGNSPTERSDFILWSHHESQEPDTDFGGAAVRQTIVNGHGLRQMYKLMEWDEQTFMTWDDTGVTINNINKTDVRNFDALSTPALPVTGLNQVAVDSAGNVWAACRLTGLYRIEDPYGSPVVTHMTEATNSLPAGSEDASYGVAIGFGGDLLVVVEGALVRSTNPTGATPTFASESFTFTGITDSNWANVEEIHSDRDSPEYQSNIVANIVTTTRQQVWWSTSETGVAGPVSDAYTVGGTSFVQTAYGHVQCSRRGSFWQWKGDAQGAVGTNLLVFGSAVENPIGSSNGAYGGPAFFYDYYDTPYALAISNGSSIGMWSADEKNYSGSDNWNIAQYFYRVSGFSFETGNGIGAYFNKDQATSSGGEGDDQPFRVSFKTPKTTDYLDPLNGQYSPHEDMIWSKYNWNGASWEKNYFVDATDTGGHASGPYPGSRENFDVEDHTFTGRSMIDVTDAFATGNFAASAAATFAFKLIPEAKLSDASDSAGTAQEKPRVLLDVSDATQQFQILWDDDIQGNITIVEDGSATVIASTPTNSSIYRLIVTVAGTAVTVYLDGNTTPIGSLTLANAFDWSNSSSDLKAFLGCRVYKWDYPQRTSPWQNDFYRGVMENVQIWNSAWDAADVTSDFGDIDGTIAGGTEPAVNQVARYELTQSLATLETKLSHAGAEALVEGITIAFANGGAPTAFIANEYHTFGVVNGIFKDNAIAFTQNYSIYFTQVDTDFTVFDNGSSGDTILASTTAIVDEKAIFMNTQNVATEITQGSGGNGSSYQTDSIPGQIGANGNVAAGHSQTTGGHTVQAISGDGYFQAEAMFGDERIIIGLTDSPDTSNTQASINFGIRLNLAGDVDIVESNVVVSAAIATYLPTDNWRVRRIGTAITYYKNGGLIYTSGTTSSGDVYGRVSLYDQGYGCKNAIITYTRPAYIVTVGDPGTPDGSFDPDYLRIETLTLESIEINIGGVPATVTIDDTFYSNMTAPGPGEVTINGQTGWLVFNAADVGSAITGNVTVILDKY